MSFEKIGPRLQVISWRKIMPLSDITVLTLILTVFISFGVLLGSLSWYCRDTSSREKQQHRNYAAARAGLMFDDD